MPGQLKIFNLGTKIGFNAAFFNFFIKSIGQRAVHGAKQLGHQLDDGDFHAKGLHDTRKLATNDATTNDEKFLGKFFPVQGLVAGTDELRVIGPEAETHGDRAGGQNDFISGQVLGTVVFFNEDFAGTIQNSKAVKGGDTAGTKQRFDSAAKPANDLVFT